MSKSKYILPIASTISAVAVFVTGVIRQLSPQGSPLTAAIILASAVNLARSVKEIVDISEEPQVPIATQLRYSDPGAIPTDVLRVHITDRLYTADIERGIR